MCDSLAHRCPWHPWISDRMHSRRNRLSPEASSPLRLGVSASGLSPLTRRRRGAGERRGEWVQLCGVGGADGALYGACSPYFAECWTPLRHSVSASGLGILTRSSASGFDTLTQGDGAPFTCPCGLVAAVPEAEGAVCGWSGARGILHEAPGAFHALTPFIRGARMLPWYLQAA